MRKNDNISKQYGDFQTPKELARIFLNLFSSHDIKPSTIIEPTCGIANIIIEAHKFYPKAKIFGFDINHDYVHKSKSHFKPFSLEKNNKIIVEQANFFEKNWDVIIKNSNKPLFIIGNPPWVNSSTISSDQGDNLPKKTNKEKMLKGIEAITGAGDFDISEYIIEKLINSIIKSPNCEDDLIAMICKQKVARDIIKYIAQKNYKLTRSKMYRINARQYFDVSVNACIFICFFNQSKSINNHYHKCEIYDLSNPHKIQGEIAYYKKKMLSHPQNFKKWSFLIGKSKYIWRSGIKHDLVKVMVLKKKKMNYFNGFNDIIDVEDDFLYPILKSSDIANNRLDKISRFVVITQKKINEKTIHLKNDAPKLWNYLNLHESLFNKRKSKIYNNKTPFSIFGVGEYSFKPYKIAISGLYPSLNFCFIRPYCEKPVLFDDTCYFLGFSNEFEAILVYHTLKSPITKNFFETFIFWDSKRPITKYILKNLKIENLIEYLGKKYYFNLIDKKKMQHNNELFNSFFS